MKFIHICIVIIILSCGESENKTYTATTLDSLTPPDTGLTEGKKMSILLDESKNKYKSTKVITQDIMKDILLDTAGNSRAPVKVMISRLVRKEYSNYKDISLTYKNVSGKKITAIRFKWYGEDAFGNPADMGGSFAEGFGGGFDDEGLGIGRSKTGEWGILSNRGKKIIAAWPTEVVFADGSKWELNQ
jgi:hypothetical protein